MAKIQFIQEKQEERPESVEQIEVRPWGVAGNVRQQFLIGGGVNFHANGTVLLEIIYTVNGIQFFYTRNYVPFTDEIESSKLLQRLEDFKKGEVNAFGFGDMFPETAIVLRREKSTYQDQNDEEQTTEHYRLDIVADVGVVLGATGPGERKFALEIRDLEREPGIQFIEDLTHEMLQAREGKRPNPADLPEGASRWQFLRELNQKAYDLVSHEYEENYFSDPLLAEMFDDWLNVLPQGSRVLDAGCGYGEPVISRLLERGHQVTGIDLSPRMLERARQNFPGVEFANQMINEITWEEEFDGICSFSSLLYLDPIDLSHSLYRLYRALKPEGLLFLFAYDTHPGWRGLPYDVELKQWMWTWSHSKEEAVQALEEHGYFKVLRVQDVTSEEEKEKRIAAWCTYEQEAHEKLQQTMPPEIALPPLDLSRVPQNLPYCYAIIAQRQPSST